MAAVPLRLRGYDRSAVDDLLDRVAATLRTGAQTVTSVQVRDARFKIKFRGYDPLSVDELLVEVIRELEDREGGTAGRSHGRVAGRWLIDWIGSVQFGAARLRPGYHERDVDAFLARVVAGLRGSAPPVTSGDVRECAFRTVRLGRGYAEQEVDRFLDQLASTLAGTRVAGSGR